MAGRPTFVVIDPHGEYSRALADGRFGPQCAGRGVNIGCGSPYWGIASTGDFEGLFARRCGRRRVLPLGFAELVMQARRGVCEECEVAVARRGVHHGRHTPIPLLTFDQSGIGLRMKTARRDRRKATQRLFASGNPGDSQTLRPAAISSRTTPVISKPDKGTALRFVRNATRPNASRIVWTHGFVSCQEPKAEASESDPLAFGHARVAGRRQADFRPRF